MKSNLVMILAASAFSAAVVIGATSTGILAPQEPQTRPSIQEGQKQKEVVGKITAIDAEQKMVQVEGTSESIKTTPTTRYLKGLSFKSLKPGMQVRITASVQSDGTLEAVEISTES